jgi:hypothetical protein
MSRNKWHVGDHELPNEEHDTCGTVSIDFYSHKAGEHFGRVQVHGDNREELAAAICAFLNRSKAE